MKFLCLIFIIVFTSIVPSFAGISSYSSSVELSPPPVEKVKPVEKNKKKKKRFNKKNKFKKHLQKHPNKIHSKKKVITLYIAGFICLTVNIAAWVITAIYFFAFAAIIVAEAFFYLGLFFAVLAITSFILASIYSKNRGVRSKKKKGSNKGKATY
jgi:hypothetical protein